MLESRKFKKSANTADGETRSRRVIHVLLFLLLVAQVISVKPYLFGAYDFMRNSTLSQSFTSEIEPYVRNATDVVIFPEWDCLSPSARDLVPYIHLAASRNAISINTTKGARQKVPYSCMQGDMYERMNRYLSMKKPGSLYFFVGDWASALEDRNIPNLTCSTFFENRYCFSRPGTSR